MNKIDLHTHTIASIDGQFEPTKLIDQAINSNIEYLAISDHDSIESLLVAQDYVKDKSINLINAIELSVEIDNVPLHILGYNIDFNDPRFKQRNDFVKSKLIDYGEKLIQKALDYGFKFDPEVAYNSRYDHLVCEEIVGEAILNDSRNDNDERLLEFRPGGSLSDNPNFNFYKHFCASGKPLNVPYSFNMPISEASTLIHSTGGKMFLAHPNHNIKHNVDLFKKIMSYGLDGVEVFSSYHSKDDIEFFYNLTKANNLYMSVGSDFHGKSKPAIKLGSIDYDKEQLDKTIKFILC